VVHLVAVDQGGEEHLGLLAARDGRGGDGALVGARRPSQQVAVRLVDQGAGRPEQPQRAAGDRRRGGRGGGGGGRGRHRRRGLRGDGGRRAADGGELAVEQVAGAAGAADVAVAAHAVDRDGLALRGDRHGAG